MNFQIDMLYNAGYIPNITWNGDLQENNSTFSILSFNFQNLYAFVGVTVGTQSCEKFRKILIYQNERKKHVENRENIV